MSDWEKREGGAYRIHGPGYRVAVNKRTDRLTGWVWLVYRIRQGRLSELCRGVAPTLAKGKRLGLGAMLNYLKYSP